MKAKFTLGDWIVDPSENTLSKQQKTFNIEPKAMLLLCLLCEAKGEVVSRENIMRHIWNDRYVTDYALNNLISSLRKYLNSDSATESYIKTRPKMGYQICAEIRPLPPLDSDQNTSENETSSVQTTLPSKQFKHGKKLFASLAFLFCLISFLFYQNTAENDDIELNDNSIAVLPFDVYDDAEKLQFFADGLSDEIIHQLNTLANFKVISRRTSFSYRDKAMDVKQIAQELGVVYILEGSIREEKDTIRSTIQLVNTQDERIVWSRVFTASQTNSFNIQYDISTSIAQSMDPSFTEFPEDKVRYTPSSNEAYMHLLRGRKLNQKGNAEANLQARDEFLMATLLDPNYAIAYVDLAISYLLLEQRKVLAPEESSDLITGAIEKALFIDQDLAEAHAALGIFHYNRNNFQLSQEAFEKALNANPKLYIALVNYANLLRAYYYPKKSQALYRRARELAPLSGPVLWGLSQTSKTLGDFEASIESAQDCVKRNPDNTNCLMTLAYTYRLNLEHNKADKILEILEGKIGANDYYYKLALAWQSLQTNQLEKANAIFEPLIERYGFEIPIQTMTYTQVGLGQEKKWWQALSTEQNPQEKGLSFIANYAHAAYFNNRCDIAMEYYELLLSHQDNLAQDIDILANGVPYLTNLAFCQQQLSKTSNANKNLNRMQSILLSLPTELAEHPAILFAKTQHAILSKNEKRAQEYLSLLSETQWGLIWLLDKDPIILSFTQAQ